MVTKSAVIGFTSQIQEKANLSTPPRKEHKLPESSVGSMSIRRSIEINKLLGKFKIISNWAIFQLEGVQKIYTCFLPERYTDVHLLAASLSMALLGLRKCETSAMWTPNSQFPLSKTRLCKASSMSVQPEDLSFEF